MASDQTPQTDKHPLHDVLHSLASTLEDLLTHIKLALPHHHETHGTPLNEDMATIAADATNVTAEVAQAAADVATEVKDA